MATLTSFELQFYSSRNEPTRDVVAGDSYAGGAPNAATSFAAGLRAQGRTVLNLGVGGLTMAGIRDRIIAHGAMVRQCSSLVIWDGSPNSYGTAEAYADQAQEAFDAAAVPFVVILPSIPYGTAAGAFADIDAEFRSRWPSQTYDWRDNIANTDGVINQNRMLDYPADTVHINLTAHNEAGAGVAPMLP